MKKELSKIIIIIGLLGSLFFATGEIIQLKKDVKTKSKTITGLLSSKRTYKTKSGKLAIEVKSLTISKNELKQANDSLLVTIDDMRIKLKHLLHYSEVVTESNLNLTLPIKDSIVYVYDTVHQKTIPDTLKTFDYQDEYNKIQAVVDLRKDSANFRQQSKDSLATALHKGKRDNWWRVWKRRPIVQTVTNCNPNVEIKYARHVKISRR